MDDMPTAQDSATQTRATQTRATQTAARWRRAGEGRDADAAIACLADEVQVISPLTAQFRFTGRDHAGDMVRAAFAVIDSISYHTEVGDDATRALFFHGRCREEEFEEAQLLRFGADGFITELTLFGRPLPGVTAVMRAIGPQWLRAKRPALARLISVGAAPMAFMARVGDRRMVPLARSQPCLSAQPSQPPLDGLSFIV